MRRSFLVLAFLTSLVYAQWVPPGSPSMEYTWHGEGESCQYMFIGLLHSISPSAFKPTNLILDAKGNVLWYQKHAHAMFDFKVHPNGWMSYNNFGDWYILDTNFNAIDTLNCEGYTTDLHDLIITNDGHYFLICMEDSSMDLSMLNTRNGIPGDTLGTVKANVIQELDAQKSVVREWHCLDHFDLTDTDSIFFTSPSQLQLNHTNSIFSDGQGNLLISHRYNHELTFINWLTGEIIWRLGGENNEFNFTNDPGPNSQHFGAVLPDGRISVFDNGTYFQPSRARGVVYTLDTATMTASNTWEFVQTGMISSAYGSFQVLNDGSTLLNFGAFTPNIYPNIVYTKADGSPVLEIKIQDLYWTYRAQCLDLPFSPPRPEITCYRQNGQLYLGTDSSYSAFSWNTGELSSAITLSDTGDFQVFVPMGVGWLGSEIFHVSDTSNACTVLARPQPGESHSRPAKLLGLYDMMGRAVTVRRKGELYLERWSDGRNRKVIQLD